LIAPPLPRVRITCGNDIPSHWGALRAAIRKGTVVIREPRGSECFVTAWGTLTATAGLDVVVSEDSGEEYPVKKSVFSKIYQETAPGRYRRTTVSSLLQVPAEVIAVLASREGELLVRYPDYLVVGTENEVYANSAEWVAANLEFL
jgi:hypothetical protein